MYRGRGRGRGGFGGRFRGGVENQKPFIHFPEDVELPDRKGINEEVALVISGSRLQNYWKTSCYVIEDKTSEKTECEDIERYSDRAKPRHRSRRESVSAYMKLEPGYFPLELVQGMKSHVRKKLKWKPNPGLDKMDLFEKREEEAKSGALKRGKEAEDEDEDNVDKEEEEEDDDEYESDGDYNKNKDFDDDDDDYNKSDSGDDEGGIF